MKILFIQTGGTIDKDYQASDKNHGYNFEICEPAVKEILSKVSPAFGFEIVSICRKDSLDLTDEDREKIFKQCQKNENRKIIITHGTDTFKKTAERLSEIKDKVVILTGAMKPEKFKDSDAMFNIGVAIGAINVLSSGIYICTGGIVNEWIDY